VNRQKLLLHIRLGEHITNLRTTTQKKSQVLISKFNYTNKKWLINAKLRRGLYHSGVFFVVTFSWIFT